MKFSLTLMLLFFPLITVAAPQEAPDRVRGDGPFDRLVLQGVTIINGEGAPAVGPMDVLIEGNRITEIRSLGILSPIARACISACIYFLQSVLTM